MGSNIPVNHGWCWAMMALSDVPVNGSLQNDGSNVNIDCQFNPTLFLNYHTEIWVWLFIFLANFVKRDNAFHFFFFGDIFITWIPYSHHLVSIWLMWTIIIIKIVLFVIVSTVQPSLTQGEVSLGSLASWLVAGRDRSRPEWELERAVLLASAGVCCCVGTTEKRSLVC